ncbi:hypothetical protein HDZ31DRAFT_67123 [Schizophyllum fasciatum]
MVPSNHLDALRKLSTSIMEGSNASDDELQHIEESIDSVMTAIAFARNSRVAVNKLPAEVLERVFLFSQPPSADFMPPWPHWDSLDWVGPSHVCTRWRAIAVAFPPLWTTLDLCRGRDPQLGRTFLSRSGNMPLTVFFSTNTFGSNNPDVQVLEDVLSLHAARLTSLHVACGTSKDVKAFCRHFDHGPPPNMLSLSVCARELIYGSSWNDPVLFGGRLGSVRRLAVVNCPIWEHNDIRDLTHLAVYDRYVDYGDNRQAFLGLLINSPRLAVLLVHTYAHLWAPQSQPFISLPHLQSLILRGYSLEPQFTLGGLLDIPKQCMVQILPGPVPMRNNLVDMLPPPHQFRPLLRRIRTLQLSLVADLVRRITMLPDATYVSGAHEWSQYAGIGNPDEKLILNMHYEYAAVKDWITLLSGMTRARTLVIVGGEDRKGLFHALSMPKGTCKQRTPCPSLRAIHVYGIFSSVAILRLWNVASRRAACGFPLREICLHGVEGRFQKGVHMCRITLNSSGAPTRIISKYDESTSLDTLTAQVVHDVKPQLPEDDVQWASISFRPASSHYSDEDSDY